MIFKYERHLSIERDCYTDVIIILVFWGKVLFILYRPQVISISGIKLTAGLVNVKMEPFLHTMEYETQKEEGAKFFFNMIGSLWDSCVFTEAVL